MASARPVDLVRLNASAPDFYDRSPRQFVSRTEWAHLASATARTAMERPGPGLPRSGEGLAATGPGSSDPRLRRGVCRAVAANPAAEAEKKSRPLSRQSWRRWGKPSGGLILTGRNLARGAQARCARRNAVRQLPFALSARFCLDSAPCFPAGGRAGRPAEFLEGVWEAPVDNAAPCGRRPRGKPRGAARITAEGGCSTLLAPLVGKGLGRRERGATGARDNKKSATQQEERDTTREARHSKRSMAP